MVFAFLMTNSNLAIEACNGDLPITSVCLCTLSKGSHHRFLLNFIHQDYSTFQTVMKNYVEDPDVELNVVHIGASEKK